MGEAGVSLDLFFYRWQFFDLYAQGASQVEEYQHNATPAPAFDTHQISRTYRRADTGRQKCDIQNCRRSGGRGIQQCSDGGDPLGPPQGAQLLHIFSGLTP
jgi:hypothetical protein